MIQYKGGDGSAKNKAIIVLGAKSEFEGVDAEHNYIERKFGYFELESTILIEDNKKRFDIIKFNSVLGVQKELWFDITDYYGKYDE